MAITRVALCLSFAFLFYVVGGAKVTFTNRCGYTVWPGTFTTAQTPQLSTTGFELGQGVTYSVNLPSSWSGRFWARTGCSINKEKFSCATADCGSGQVGCNGAGAIPPATLVEITMASNGGQDFYDVSNVDGFNVPIFVTPQGGNGPCKAASCPANINAVCPAELQVKGSDGSVVACKSACLAFNTDQYCCRGSYNTEATCPPTNYSMVFKNQCPDAYSYAYDNTSSTFTCSGGPDYAIIFCPSQHLLYPSVTVDGSHYFKCY
ncbi:putative thaumatin [Medicago truncatula]|uniref:Allergen Pru protein, putative n=1 Tax=Medicago truncatula TaxID=3880 RepID=A0A072VJZ1_MEDTR|nr:thaumatin-like protein 1b [Medicago truncatula]KEH42142.1 allergen Pru protein, putative [Medicago truncatula]RHN79698.1 putative thaumatin [Medicago truncatula]